MSVCTVKTRCIIPVPEVLLCICDPSTLAKCETPSLQAPAADVEHPWDNGVLMHFMGDVETHDSESCSLWIGRFGCYWESKGDEYDVLWRISGKLQSSMTKGIIKPYELIAD